MLDPKLIRWFDSLTPTQQGEFMAEVLAGKKSNWSKEYKSNITGKIWRPQNDEVAIFVFDDKPTNVLLKGGEGGGKSSSGVIKTLGKIRRGLNGIMVSTDLEHFKKSLWPVFCEWCPWDCVIESQRRRSLPSWEPHTSFTMVFNNEVRGQSTLICGGAKEDGIGGWEGPNVNFVYFDEVRRHRTPIAIKTFSGRIRIDGPNNEPPQLFLTTTPKKHWLYEYFGPIEKNDKLEAFKRDSYTATVLTEENTANLSEGFVEQRAQSLNEAEVRVLLRAEWEDIADSEKFVNIIWWDACKGQLPELTRSEPVVIALDAATGGTTTQADCFAMVMVSRHPGEDRKQDVAVRYCGIWNPPPGGYLDFAPIEEELVRLCKTYAMIEVTFDRHQLHDMAMRLSKKGIANFREFSQTKDRLIADKQLQTLIMERRISHDGNPLLREHIDNAYVKKTEDKLRIVKQSPSLKVDSVVSLAMASHRILYFNI